VNGSAYNLHNSTLGMPIIFGCKVCHTSYADKYGALISLAQIWQEEATQAVKDAMAAEH